MRSKADTAPARAVAECLGTAFLLAGVVGSGIMAAKLSGGNGAVALLCNTLSTGAILTVLILTFGPISGAHFNPAASIAMAIRRELSGSVAAIYIGAQLIGAIAGVWAAHLMFELPLWQVSLHGRTGVGQWFAEFIATFGLLLTIFGCVARTLAAVAYAVGLYITAAYWFTASTRSLILPSRLPVLCPILLRGFRRAEFSHLSRRNSQVCLRRHCSGVGCGPSNRQNDQI